MKPVWTPIKLLSYCSLFCFCTINKGHWAPIIQTDELVLTICFTIKFLKPEQQAWSSSPTWSGLVIRQLWICLFTGSDHRKRTAFIKAKSTEAGAHDCKWGRSRRQDYYLLSPRVVSGVGMHPSYRARELCGHLSFHSTSSSPSIYWQGVSCMALNRTPKDSF